MKPICLDSHLYIWGVKGVANEDQQNMIQLAKNFLEYIDEERIPVILPTTIISELLAPVEPSRHESFLKLLNTRFRVVPFDMVASVKLAEIWHNKKDSETLKNYRKEYSINREVMKFDFQIAAIAITRGCECIYSHDPHMEKFVGDIITVRQMPKIGKQARLDI